MVKSILTIKIETWVGIVVVGLAAVLLGKVVLSSIADFNHYVEIINSEYSVEGVAFLSLKQIREIDKWIRDQGLNEYGDPIGTVYNDGAPLFNRISGEKNSRFEYIFRKYPDRPWRVRE